MNKDFYWVVLGIIMIALSRVSYSLNLDMEDTGSDAAKPLGVLQSRLFLWMLEKQADFSGIEEYYDGVKSFDEAYGELKEDYMLCYSNDEDEQIRLASFHEVKQCSRSGIDCEDFAFLVRKLASLYGYPCEFEVTKKHVGVICEVDGNAEVLG